MLGALVVGDVLGACVGGLDGFRVGDVLGEFVAGDTLPSSLTSGITIVAPQGQPN